MTRTTRHTDTAPVIVWLRRDLRLHDNPALHWAAAQSRPLLPVYIHSPGASDWRDGAASRWWLHHSLKRFDESLKTLGSRLYILSGEAPEQLQTLLQRTRPQAVVWNRRYEPDSIAIDAEIKASLKASGITAKSFTGNVCHEPWTIVKADATPYRVFSAWWRAAQTAESATPVAAVASITPWRGRLAGTAKLNDLQLLPQKKWADGFSAQWSPGEPGAMRSLEAALNTQLADYNESRDLPALAGTSRLSAHLAFGEISARTVVARARAHCYWKKADTREHLQGFVRQIGWRDFASHLLFHFPHTPDQPLDRRFEKFPWRSNPDQLRLWQQGQTGIPMVDAGMRELWQTGWMHNRVRMITASLLIKNLGIHWLEGAKWFWDTLVDADLANNTMGWQWVAGSGADAAPYFRVFSPQRQGARFDANGDYVRHWVPELSALPDKYIHSPWEAPASALKQAGIVLGSDYPEPIVDLGASRKQALERFATIKNE